MEKPSAKAYLENIIYTPLLLHLLYLLLTFKIDFCRISLHIDHDSQSVVV